MCEGYKTENNYQNNVYPVHEWKTYISIEYNQIDDQISFMALFYCHRRHRRIVVVLVFAIIVGDVFVAARHHRHRVVVIIAEVIASLYQLPSIVFFSSSL